MSDNLCAMLKTYLGAGQEGGYLPYGNEERMLKAYATEANAKLAEIQKYLAIDHAPSEWSHADLAIEQNTFEALLLKRFPELDKVAANALACRWSYSWK